MEETRGCNKDIEARDMSTTAGTASADLTRYSEKNREGVSNESGYFEEEDEGITEDDSIEIIFDKNATNNNCDKGSHAVTGKFLFHEILDNMV